MWTALELALTTFRALNRCARCFVPGANVATAKAFAVLFLNLRVIIRRLMVLPL